jgi:type II secretory pathway predicted ATPase ExeA
MDLSRKILDYWGFEAKSVPFGNTIKSAESVFAWPEFESKVSGLLAAIKRRRMIALVGSTCSAKTVIFETARRRMYEETTGWSCCKPRSNETSEFNEMALLQTIKDELMPFDGSRDTAFRRGREARARQVRQLLERENSQDHPVTLVINDAHDCSVRFLLLCKRTWDDLHGFDRLLSVIFIGQAALARTIINCDEIGQRLDILHTPGLGDYLQQYLQHELGRCGCANWMFTEDAVEELAKLQGPVSRDTGKPGWQNRRDHPLIVNNVVSRALAGGFAIKAKQVGRDLVSAAMREEA